MNEALKALSWVKPWPLLAGFLIGIVAILVHRPAPVVVYKYPTPKTCGQFMYKDAGGACFRFETEEVDCDKNEAKLKDFPLQ